MERRCGPRPRRRQRAVWAARVGDRAVPVDPWGRPYQYNQPGRDGEPYEVICFGADGREGGTGGDADITSSDLRVGGKEAR